MAHHALQAVRTIEQVVGQFGAHHQRIEIPDHGAQGVGFGIGRDDEVGHRADDVFAYGYGRIGEQDFLAGHGGFYFFSLERSGMAIGISDSNARAARITSASA